VTTADAAGISRQRFTLAQLATPVVVYRFVHGSAASADTVRLTYALPRTARHVDPNAAARLTQHSSSARIVEWDAPFAPQSVTTLRALGAAPAPAPPLQGSAYEPGVYGGVAVGIAPYYPGYPLGAFQSTPDSRTASSSIEITFDKPVMAVYVTAEDPTWPGNTMSAYDTTGALVATVEFDGSGRPGHNIPSIKSIGTGGRNTIARIVLTPAPDEYIAYDAVRFERDTTCALFKDPAKVTDDVLKDPAFQAAMKQMIQEIGWDQPLHDQVERAGIFVQDELTGETSFVPSDGEDIIPANPCLSGTSSTQLEDLKANGFKILGQVHTHPNTPYFGRDPGNCLDVVTRNGRPTLEPRKGDSNGNMSFPRGPSDKDKGPWRSPGRGKVPPDYPGLVIEPSGVTIWRIDARGKFVDSKIELSDCARSIKRAPPPPPPPPPTPT
jgi:hypothetical protein